MGRRSRKERPAPGAPRPAAPAQPDRMRRGYARGEQRNEEVRRKLAPVGEHERPAVLLVAAAIAAVLGVDNVVAYAAGVKVQGQKADLLGVVLLAILMLSAAWGMFNKRYWAVLGFEALLGITMAFAALSLLVASNLAALALCLGILLGGGYLFWKLIRVMARLQTPRRVP
ncbi:MAG: hypothetical protein ACXVFN_13060 [Solirubrobacteraceae bacterium]